MNVPSGAFEINTGRNRSSMELKNSALSYAFRARKVVHPITREELDAITDVWVDAAFRLQDRDLKMMGRIVRAQMRRTDIGDVDNVVDHALAEEQVALAG